jgi:hypothetical protein
MSEPLFVFGPLAAKFMILAAVIASGVVGALLGMGSAWDAQDRIIRQEIADETPRQWR